MGCKNREKTWEKEWGRREIKKALCGNRRPSNDCLPYEKSSNNLCGVGGKAAQK